MHTLYRNFIRYCKKRLKSFEKEKWKEVRLKDLVERVTRKNNVGNKNVVTISARRGFVKQTDFFKKSIASELLDNYFLVERENFVTIKVIQMDIHGVPLKD